MEEVQRTNNVTCNYIIGRPHRAHCKSLTNKNIQIIKKKEKKKDGYRSGGGYLQIRIFYILSTKKHRENGKSTGKTQVKHREFGINWSVATLFHNLKNFMMLVSNFSSQKVNVCESLIRRMIE